MQAGCSTPSLTQGQRGHQLLSGDDVKAENPYEQDADIDRRTEANRSHGKSTLARDARTYPPSVFIPSQMRWPNENWSVQVVSSEGVDPKPQAALRFTLSTSFVTNTIC